MAIDISWFICLRPSESGTGRPADRCRRRSWALANIVVYVKDGLGHYKFEAPADAVSAGLVLPDPFGRVRDVLQDGRLKRIVDKYRNANEARPSTFDSLTHRSQERNNGIPAHSNSPQEAHDASTNPEGSVFDVA
jgi:hypothetical protein